MKNIGLCYLLCAIGFLGPAGIHRFYLGKPISGFFYLITFGFFGIGTFVDLIRMPELVAFANFKAARGNVTLPEKEILKLAARHDGTVTIQMVTMNSSLSLHNAHRELERLKNNGFCQKDVGEDGTELYVFSGLRPRKPLSLSNTI